MFMMYAAWTSLLAFQMSRRLLVPLLDRALEEHHLLCMYLKGFNITYCTVGYSHL
jgi:hypothetical protein